MKLRISEPTLREIHAHGESAYPEEGAGLLLGSENGAARRVEGVLPLNNAREDTARHNRYLIAPEDMIRADEEADRRGLKVIGVFHSHPDHPDRPSEIDLEWALPWFSYLITSVEGGKARSSRSWRLEEDRGQFVQERLVIAPQTEDEQTG